jgi:Flp pilus assembly protein CpaB
VVTSLCAIGVFLGLLTYVGSVSSQVGPMVSAVQLKQAVEPLTPIEPDMLEVVEVPERWAPEAAIDSVDETSGLVAATGYEAGTLVQTGMFVPRPGIQPGFREVAIIVDAETGVAGKVSPGDHVDIIATVEETEGRAPSSEVWVENALVLDVGLPQEIEEERGDDYGSSQGVPVTFSLTTEDSLRLAYAESFSVKLRLALRGAGDEQTLPAEERTYTAEGQ